MFIHFKNVLAQNKVMSRHRTKNVLKIPTCKLKVGWNINRIIFKQNRIQHFWVWWMFFKCFIFATNIFYWSNTETYLFSNFEVPNYINNFCIKFLAWSSPQKWGRSGNGSTLFLIYTLSGPIRVVSFLIYTLSGPIRVVSFSDMLTFRAHSFQERVELFLKPKAF